MSRPRPAGEIAGAVAAADLLGRPGSGPLLLMCSPGRDSMTLLDLAATLREPDELMVLHVDHGLRDASGDDAKHVQAAAAARGVEVRVEHAGTPPAQGNLHAWARGRRALLADQAAGSRWPGCTPGAVRIATAHTLTDLAETALGRLASQPGRRALLSMRPHEVTAAGHRLVRPLLGVTREETAAYCTERGLRWRDDPSNAHRRFARARLRHEVLPVLRALNPRAEAHIARTLAELEDESAALDAVIAAELPLGGELPVAQLTERPPALARLILRAFCERETRQRCPQVAERLDDVVALGGAAARNGRAALDAGGGLRIELRGGMVRAARSQGPAAPYTGRRA